MHMAMRFCGACGSSSFEIDWSSNTVSCKKCGARYHVSDMFDANPQSRQQNAGYDLQDFEIVAGTLVRYRGRSMQARVPEGVVEIGGITPAQYSRDMIPTRRTIISPEIPGAFTGMSALTSIVLPSTLRAIGDKAVAGCASIRELVIPNGVKTIGKQAFSGCTSLQRIVLPKTLQSIGDSAFENCKNLRSVEVPDNTQIGKNLFQSCASLASAKLPARLAVIPPKMFYGCGALSSVMIPAQVVSIGNSAFMGCRSLQMLELPESLKRIANHAFDGAGLTTMVIPRGVTLLGEKAFSNCAQLQSLTMPDRLTNAEPDAKRRPVSDEIPMELNSFDELSILYEMVGSHYSPYIYKSICRNCPNLTTIHGAKRYPQQLFWGSAWYRRNYTDKRRCWGCGRKVPFYKDRCSACSTYFDPDHD